MIKIALPALVLLLSGCATKDPSLAELVERKGDGLYKSKTVGYVDGLDEAVKQCKIDGDKKLEIVTTATEYSYVLKRNMPVYIFKCIDK